MISAHGMGMQFGGKILYAEVDLQLKPQKRYGLVGANGTGKTTFFKLLSGEEEVSAGNISIPKSHSIGYLNQDHYTLDDTKVVDVVMMGDTQLWPIIEKRDHLYATGDFEQEKTGLQLAELEAQFAEAGGYTAESRAQTILSGLGLAIETHAEPLKHLSGGMKLRVLLAQTLFQNPDILLLDEPTNHLDITSIAWLEQYLVQRYQGILVLISHDQSFLNRVVTHILDIDYGDITLYTGNYVKFEEQKELMAEQRKIELESKQAKIDHLKNYIERFGAKASKAKQAQSKAKQIDRIELPDIQRSSRCFPKIQFECKRKPGEQVAEVKGISHAYDDHIVLFDVDLTVMRGDRIGIVGANGMGKSTLLKVMMDELKQDAGSVEWGYETHVGYFAQNHHDQLKGKETVLNWLLSQDISGISEQQGRDALARMLFQKDDVHKPINFLSGGEAARLLLARLMLQKPNVLILDEPTNHLDIESIQSLVKALRTYKGTLIIVSHNRYFLSKTIKEATLLTEDGAKSLGGKWEQALFESA